MLLGEYEYRIDQKGRIAIPARLRGEFKDGLVLTRGFDKCVLAYPLPEWHKFSDSFANLPITQDKNRDIRRFLFASAFITELDGQGRAALPSPLRHYAQITEVAIIAGGSEYLEIWGKELWEEKRQFMEEHAWLIAERMEQR